MTAAEVLRRLARLGTEQNRATYRRHGVGPELYGVSYANLEKLRRELAGEIRAGRLDAQALAAELWATGNHDARVLATRIADPAALDRRTLEAWAAGLDNYVLTDAFAVLAARTAAARDCFERWSRSQNEWRGRAGWLILGQLALQESSQEAAAREKQPELDFAAHLATIEHEIHSRKNRVRDAMNSALIAIGLRSAELQARALAAATRIGKVEVDHGETGCKTPDAAAYIRKATAHRASRRQSRDATPPQNRAAARQNTAGRTVARRAATRSKH
ncbi:MAG: DNA alkylation repair protein [Planctomycetota bacterium]